MAHLNALGRHLALAGFMGSGKTRAGEELAQRLGRSFVDLDRRIEARTGSMVAELFVNRGEAGFRAVEESMAREVLHEADPLVIALGGGAVLSERTRSELAARAFTVLLDVEPETAWERVGGSDRPLAQDEEAFHALHRDRQPLYEDASDARARDVEGILLAAAGVHVESGAIDELGDLVPGDAPVELVADAHVSGIHGIRGQVALGARDVALHEVPAGEPAKTAAVLERLWGRFTIGRDGTVVALGGGSTTDVAGLAAATFMRGVAWTAVPTTLVGQVDAGIGGKTAIDLPGAKNAVGAFHWPDRVVCDPSLLTTLPEAERLNGLAEVVKTGLLAGAPLWELLRARAGALVRGLQVGGLPRRPAGPRAADAAQSRPHLRARARDGGRIWAPARPRRRAGVARRAPPDGPRRRGADGAGGARTRAGSGRPRDRVGRARAGQEGGTGHAAARPSRRAGKCRGGASSCPRRTSGARSTS